MSLKLHSLNVRGLQNGIKRKTIFDWIKDKYYGICLLQETHSTESLESQWNKEWDGKIIYCHGTSKSAGVAILIPKQIIEEISIKQIKTVIKGRMVIVELELNGTTIIIVNIYAPTKDKSKEQVDLFEKLEENLDEYTDKPIIIGGDMNVCLDPKLDSSNNQSNPSNSSIRLKMLLENHDLIDIWRVKYPESKRFTWRNRSRYGYSQSRLDYFFCSNHLMYSLNKTSINASIKTDHSIISIELDLQIENQSKGPGFWKLNNSLLSELEYVNRIKDLIKNAKDKYDYLEDKALKWDIIKCDIRAETISYATWKKKKVTERERELTNIINELEVQIQCDEEKYEEYLEHKQELEKIKDDKSKGIMVRSRAKHIEDNEKCTKYFCQLEKRNYLKRNITSLVSNDGRSISKMTDILKEELGFYKSLYSKQSDSECEDACSLLDIDVPSITQDENLLLEKDITMEECTKGLKELSNNKTPGTDGLSPEFYKTFWIDIKQFVFDSFVSAKKNGLLSLDQRRGILTLLPKGDKDPKYLKNWRPLTLLNTDYKILAKVLSNRLQNVISKIIHNDQVGYIKGRQLSFNCRKILDVFENKEFDLDPGYALFLDFQKAFDTISRDFMIKALRRFNFGENFIDWIKLIYSKPLSCVTNNGYSSEFFETERGIRQGCPVSAILFVIVAEILSINIRQNESIKGVNISNYEITVAQMADDTTLFLKDNESINNVLKTLHHFGKCAGLKLNKEKTKVIKLGVSQKDQNKTFGLNWTQGPIKVTGIYVGKDLKENETMTLNEKYMKMKSILSMWRTRNLTIKGKITLLRSQIIPLVLYVASIYPLSDSFVKKIDTLMFDFVWPNKKHHVKKNVLIKEIEEGGLKMPDLNSIVKSVKLNWIKFSFSKCETVKRYVENITNINDLKSFLSYKYDMIYIKDRIPLFYKQLFQYWFELHSRPPETRNEILNEMVCNNKYILIGKKPIEKKRWKTNEDIILHDLFDTTGKILGIKEVERKLKIVIDQMFYNSAISAIPKEWKTKLKSNENYDFTRTNPLSLKIENKITAVSFELKCKKICKELINLKTKDVIPTATLKWENIYMNHDFDWKEIFTLPFKVCRETKLQSFQYQIINRYIASNNMLYKWGKSESPSCTKCNETEDIEHLLYHCKGVKPFWKEFHKFWETCYGFVINLTIEEVLFGISNKMNMPELHALNFCMLMAKKFIYSSNLDGKEPSFRFFWGQLKNRMTIEKQINLQNQTYEEFKNMYGPMEKVFEKWRNDNLLRLRID